MPTSKPRGGITGLSGIDNSEGGGNTRMGDGADTISLTESATKKQYYARGAADTISISETPSSELIPSETSSTVTLTWVDGPTWNSPGDVVLLDKVTVIAAGAAGMDGDGVNGQGGGGGGQRVIATDVAIVSGDTHSIVWNGPSDLGEGGGYTYLTLDSGSGIIFANGGGFSGGGGVGGAGGTGTGSSIAVTEIDGGRGGDVGVVYFGGGGGQAGGEISAGGDGQSAPDYLGGWNGVDTNGKGGNGANGLEEEPDESAAGTPGHDYGGGGGGGAKTGVGGGGSQDAIIIIYQEPI